MIFDTFTVLRVHSLIRLFEVTSVHTADQRVFTVTVNAIMEEKICQFFLR